MANTTPRRFQRPKQRSLLGDAPWNEGDPTRMIAINIPLPEPLMIQLDFLVEHNLIRSKASFTRDILARAAQELIEQHSLMQQAMRELQERRQGERREAPRRASPEPGRRKADRRRPT
ncbi:MAG TPA: hypothetical protein VJ652_15145 [Noviherbaspirillum sp.]|nr:hypothetical protein [Noviherbaspirillum sp.]